MPQFPKGHNSLSVLVQTGEANGKKVYQRVHNPKLSEAERQALIHKQSSKKKPLTPAQKENAKAKARARYDKLLADASRTRQRSYKPRSSGGVTLNILR